MARAVVYLTMSTRILVVEDEALIAEEIRDRLIRLGYDVVDTVDTGADALAAAELTRPDLVLMDVHLKGAIDGIQAADQISRWLGTPVVFLTAYSDQATVERARSVAQFGYVLKPYSERDLLVAIEMATYRHQQEQALKESQLSYAAILTSSSDAILATDDIGKVRYLNPVAEALLGWGIGEAQGRPIEQVLTVLDELSGVRVRNPVTHVLTERTSFRIGDEHLLLARDGALVPIEGDVSPVLGPYGKLTGAVLVCRGVAERKRSEETRARLAAMVESAADAIIGTDLNGIILSWNPAAERLFGYTAAEAIGQPAAILHPANHEDDGRHLLERIRLGERVELTDAPRRRKDGSLVEVWLTASPVRDARGQIIGAAKIVREITAERERRQQIIQDEKLRALGQLASGVAHDLNQYLGLIAGHGELALGALSAAWTDHAGIRDSLDVMVKSAMDGGETVRRLLAFARSHEDESRRHFDMGALLDEVAKLTAPRWRDAAQEEGRPISIELHAIGETTVEGHPASLREALTNLILNAVDAMPSGGTIALLARRQDDRVEVEIADSGVGMSDEVLARVFEPYFTTKGEKGTGLGLATVYGIVSQSGGQVAFATAPGAGTKFRIHLPRLALEAEEEDRAPEVDAASEGDETVLVAEDQEPVRQMLEVLASTGALTDLVATGARIVEPDRRVMTGELYPPVAGGESLRSYDPEPRAGGHADPPRAIGVALALAGAHPTRQARRAGRRPGRRRRRNRVHHHCAAGCRGREAALPVSPRVVRPRYGTAARGSAAAAFGEDPAGGARGDGLRHGRGGENGMNPASASPPTAPSDPRSPSPAPPRAGIARNRLTVETRTAVITGILCIVLIITLMQLWLLTATMNAFLGGDHAVAWPALGASIVCLLLNLGLLRYLYLLEKPR